MTTKPKDSIFLFPDLKTVISIFVLSVSIYALGLFFLEPDTFRKLLSAIMLSMSVSVLIGYAKGFIDHQINSEVRFLIAGILSTWAAVAYARAYQLIYLDYINPFMAPLHVTFWDGFFSTFGYFLIVIGGLFHLTAPGALDGANPRQNWLKLGCSVGAGLLLFLVTSYIL